MDIRTYIQHSINTKTKILNNNETLLTIQKVVNIIVDGYKNNKKVLVAGNGGSAGDAQHIAGELVAKLFYDRPGLNAISLVTNSSILTAISNDYDYKEIFARQIQANGCKGDTFIGISTSGNSESIVLALQEAIQKEIITVGLTGEKVCEMDKYCDYIIHVPSVSTPIIQEAHIMIGHIICALVEEAFLENN